LTIVSKAVQYYVMKVSSDLSGIKSWPTGDRPREKLFRQGAHKLSSSELLAIILGSGTRGLSALDLGRQIIQHFKQLRGMESAEPAQWRKIKGLGAAKIACLKAAVELGKRIREEEALDLGPGIKSSADAARIVLPGLRDCKREIFKVFFLNSRHKIIDIVEVVEGTVDQANPIIREIFHKALQHFAAAIICAHNHPSGNREPSPQDKAFTCDLVKAGKVIGVEVLDHIIIAGEDYYSFADAGEI